MVLILTAFTLFHLAVGAASLGLAVRLLTAQERSHWRSKGALIVAQVLCWVYPALAFAAASWAWRGFRDAAPYALPLMLSPIAWLLVMGFVFALVDYLDDGVLGNARSRSPSTD